MKKILSLGLVLILTLGLVACGSSNNGASETDNSANANVAGEAGAPANKLEEIKDKGVLVVATDANYPPFDFPAIIDGNQEIVGIDMDIGQAIADDLGVELEIQNVEFSSILAGVETGLYDLAIAGLTYSEERDEVLDFSDPYYQSRFTLTVLKDQEDDFKTLDDMVGKSVGVQTGTVQEQVAQGLEGVEIVSMGNFSDLLLQLKTGAIDSVMSEEPVAELNVLENPDLAVSDIDLDYEVGKMIAAQEGQAELLEEVNKTISKLIDGGKIEEFYQKSLELLEK